MTGARTVRIGPRSSARWPSPGELGAIGLALLIASAGTLSASPLLLPPGPSPGGRPAPGAAVAPLRTAVSGPIALGEQSVEFSVGTGTVAAVYAPLVSIGNGTIYPGNASRANASFSGTNATLSVSLPGLAPTRVTVPALGVRTVALIGLNYSVAGTPVSVYVDLDGSVNGTTFVGANGTGGGVAFSWTAPATLSVPFIATGPAPGSVDVGVSNLSYRLVVGIVARGLVGGLPVSVPIVPSTALPEATGTPANVAGRFAIVAPPSPGGPSNPPRSSGSAPGLAEPLVLAAIAVALVVGLALGWTVRSRASGGPSVPRRCPACGRRVPRGASFCPGCSRPVGPGPPGAPP